MSQQNGKVKTKGRLKLVQALELRAGGASYRQIADVLGVSRASAWRIVTRGLDELTAKCAEKAEQVKALELVRMDAMRVLLWPKRADPRVADSLLRISERVAKLHGLDAPAKHELTGADGGPIETQESNPVPDLTKLTDEEIGQLAKINTKLRKG